VAVLSAKAGADGNARAEVELRAAPQGVRRVELNAAADVLRLNSPNRLGSVLRHSSTVVLSRANNWRAVVQLDMPVATLARSLALNPRYRHVAELAVVARDTASERVHFAHRVVPLPKPTLAVAAPTRLAKSELAQQQGEAAVEAHVTSPYAEDAKGVCVRVRTLHHADLGLDAKHCFDSWAAGETKTLAAALKGKLAHVAEGNYKLSFAVSAPEQATVKAVHALTVE